MLAASVAAHGQDRVGRVGPCAGAHAPRRRPLALRARGPPREPRDGGFRGNPEDGGGDGVPAEKVTVVPNLVDVNSVSSIRPGASSCGARGGLDEQTLVVGCVSRFQRRKRNDVAIDAMSYLDDDVLLVLAGEGEEEGALRARAAPYGDRIRFAPNVRGHVESFLSACDVLVFTPSPTEGEPRVIVMAGLVGVPVIATDPRARMG